MSAARPLSVGAYAPLPRKDADRDVVDARRSAEWDHSVLCVSLVVVFAMATRAVGPRRASQCAVSYSIAPVGALPCDRSLAFGSLGLRLRQEQPQ